MTFDRTRQQDEWNERALAAQRAAAQAFARLLKIAETSDSGQANRIAKFIASCWNGLGFPYDVFELRTFDRAGADFLNTPMSANSV
jgi:hypothetical protein